MSMNNGDVDMASDLCAMGPYSIQCYRRPLQIYYFELAIGCEVAYIMTCNILNCIYTFVIFRIRRNCLVICSALACNSVIRVTVHGRNHRTNIFIAYRIY